MTIMIHEIPFDWMRDELTITGSIKRGEQGSKARLVQEWLTLNGIGLKLDDDYGGVTETAVTMFQAASALDETGEVDQTTLDMLVAPMLRALTPPGHTLSYGEFIADYARRHLNERPREIGGQNRGPWVRLYMHGHEGNDYPWCAGFVSLVMRQSALHLGVDLPVTTSFGCDELAQNAKDRNRFYSELEADDGSNSSGLFGALFLNRKTATDWTHTGVVTAFGEGYFHTIEGNTNDEGGREGYEVCERLRGYSDTDFILLGDQSGL